MSTEVEVKKVNIARHIETIFTIEEILKLGPQMKTRIVCSEYSLSDAEDIAAERALRYSKSYIVKQRMSSIICTITPKEVT